MAFPRTKFREAVLLLLYNWEIRKEKIGVAYPLMMEQLKASKKNIEAAWDYACEVWSKVPEIDEKIREKSDEYAFERITKVELSALRLGLYEMQLAPDIPETVALAEAKRLSKKFSSPEAAQFVGAILDSFITKAPVS